MQHFGKPAKDSAARRIFTISLSLFLVMSLVFSLPAFAQSASSAQAYFGSTQNGVTVTNMFAPTLLFSGQLKTSNVGSILAGVSMDACFGPTPAPLLPAVAAKTPAAPAQPLESLSTWTEVRCNPDKLSIVIACRPWASL